ncbi:MAG: hypothetical protein Q9222_005702 [Ikaeria aurantiellina]
MVRQMESISAVALSELLLPSIARTPEVSHHPLDMLNLEYQILVYAALNAEAIVDCQARVQCKSLKVSIRIGVQGTVMAIRPQFSDTEPTSQIYDGHVALHGWLGQGGGNGVAALLARFVPW